MLAALFIQGGIDALRAPEAHAQAAKPVLDAVPVEQRPDDVLLIKLDAGVKIAAGTLLALGKFPRLAATALAATLIPTKLANHRFWEEADSQRKQQQQIHFMKNVGLLGGLLIAAADTEGKPSLGWRGRKAATLAAAQAADVTGRVTGAVHDAGGKLSGSAHQAGGTVAGIAAGLAGLAPAAGAAVTSRAGAELASRAAELSRRAAKARRRAEKRGAKLQKLAKKRGAQLQKAAEKRSARLQKRAEKRGAEIQKRLEGAGHTAGKLGHDVAARASAVRSEVTQQAGGLAKDARKRAHALTH